MRFQRAFVFYQPKLGAKTFILEGKFTFQALVFPSLLLINKSWKRQQIHLGCQPLFYKIVWKPHESSANEIRQMQPRTFLPYLRKWFKRFNGFKLFSAFIFKQSIGTIKNTDWLPEHLVVQIVGSDENFESGFKR